MCLHGCLSSDTVFSSIDQTSRYAYSAQPDITLWNLARLAECLLPLLAPDQDAAVALAEVALRSFSPLFEAAYHAGLCRKLGFAEPNETRLKFAQELLVLMADSAADFTLTFHWLTDVAAGSSALLLELFKDQTAVEVWLTRWRSLLDAGSVDDAMPISIPQSTNPVFIPRNHLVEETIPMHNKPYQKVRPAKICE